MGGEGGGEHPDRAAGRERERVGNGEPEPTVCAENGKEKRSVSECQVCLRNKIATNRGFYR